MNKTLQLLGGFERLAFGSRGTITEVLGDQEVNQIDTSVLGTSDNTEDRGNGTSFSTVLFELVFVQDLVRCLA